MNFRRVDWPIFFPFDISVKLGYLYTKTDSVIGIHLSYYGPVAQNAKQQQQQQKQHYIGSNQKEKK